VDFFWTTLSVRGWRKRPIPTCWVVLDANDENEPARTRQVRVASSIAPPRDRW